MTVEKANKEVQDFERVIESGITLTVAEKNYLRFLKNFLATH